MAFERQALGKRGEDLALDYFLKRKYRLLERNYRCSLGEADLVFEKDKSLVFVEVKTRTSRLFGEPEEAVSFHKKRKLAQIAEFYLKESRFAGSEIRFDVLSVVLAENGAPEIIHFENALDFDRI